MNTEHQKTQKALSKLLSFVLRHSPETISLSLDQNGWVDTNDLLQALGNAGKETSLEDLKAVVADNNKQRFTFSDDFSKIRASQGHSININLELVAKEPPKQLFHGTALQNLDSIKADGILKGKRQFVHLSIDYETAKQVGGRHGKPVILKIDTAAMHEAGIRFYLSDNNVWLTDHVPSSYILESDEKDNK